MNALLDKVLLRAKILRRALRILPKKRKRIRLIYFNHVPDIDSSDTLIIRYRFTNAIYFDIDGKKTFENRYVFARPDSKKDILITVHGFLRKAYYTITVDRDNVFITKKLHIPT